MKNLISAAVACLLTLAGTASAADWGDLKLRFVYDGPAPKKTPIDVTKDAQFCGKHNLVDEKLVVNPKNSGVANIVVFLYVKRGGAQPPVHPDYAKTANAKVRIDNENCRFEPRVLAIRTSQTLVLGNKDPVGHNSKVDFFTNTAINPIIPANKTHQEKLSAEERLPARVSCSIHPWMTGWLVVKKHPYMGATNKDGEIELKNVPAGNWTFQVWHEKSGYVQQVTQDGKAKSWKRGRVELTIKPGKKTDLGVLKLSPKIFEK